MLYVGGKPQKKKPLVFVDVNLGKDKGKQKMTIYQGDDPKVVAEKFAASFCKPIKRFAD